jgi:hypothetical protein
LVTVFIFFLERVLHQLANQVERFLVLHADDPLDPHRVHIERLAAVFGMGADQRVHPWRRHLPGAVLAQRP